MATVTLTSRFSELDGWVGRLFEAPDGTVINTKTPTTFAFTYPVGSEFAGYKVTITGSDFTYDGTTPTGGTMSKIVVTDDTGGTVLTIAGLAADTPASDLSLFASSVFGWSNPNGEHNGDPNYAWSLILSGNDTINGTTGDDRRGFAGVDAGNDVYNMKAGDDFVNGGIGNDSINGGEDWDTLSFGETHYNQGTTATRGLDVNVQTGIVLDPWGGTDQITGIEQFEGSAFNDTFLGSNTEGDWFSGLRGADTFKGAGGDNGVASGGDFVKYDSDTWYGGNRGIVVDLSVSVSGANITGSIKDGFGNTDKTINIESVVGTRYNDSFVGSSAQNVFVGGEGKDSYNGDSGQDILWLMWYFTDQPQTGVTVDLSLASGQIVNDCFGNTENAISIEDIVGSSQNDKIKGSTGSNVLEGFNGKDTLTGAGGADEFKYFNFDDLGDNDVITDFVSGAGANQDQIELFVSEWGATTTLTLVNGSAATQAVSTFIFNPNNSVLYWDPDGTGADAKIAICTLNGVSSLSAANFELW